MTDHLQAAWAQYQTTPEYASDVEAAELLRISTWTTAMVQCAFAAGFHAHQRLTEEEIQSRVDKGTLRGGQDLPQPAKGDK